MFHVVCRVALAALFCLTLIPYADAEEDMQIAKVYRDYPGYIEPPTCINPLLSDNKTGHSSSATLQNWNCPQSWTLTPMIGYHLIDGGLDLEDNAAFGLSVGYNLSCNWAIEADLRYTSTETDFAQGNNLDVDIWTLGGSVLYHFQPAQRLNPYLLAGAGVISYDVDGTSHTDEDYMGFWGGGLKYAMNQNMALRADVRHLVDYHSRADFDRHDDSSWRHHVNVMLGLTFLFGH